LVFDIINLILATCSILFSVYVFLKNKLYSKSSVENAVYSNIATALTQLSAAASDYAVFKNDSGELAEQQRTNYFNAIASVLDAYNFACQQYYSRILNSASFANCYASKIEALFEDPIYQTELQKPNYYHYLHKYHQQNSNK